MRVRASLRFISKSLTRRPVPVRAIGSNGDQAHLAAATQVKGNSGANHKPTTPGRNVTTRSKTGHDLIARSLRQVFRQAWQENLADLALNPRSKSPTNSA